jgi:ketosteroid isomerase-like protein
MPTLSNILMATLGAGLTLACARVHSEPSAQDAVQMLIQRSKDSNTSLMRGDIEQYLSQLALGHDFTLMSPFGGPPSHGIPSRDAWDRIGKFFKNGSHEQELVQAYGTRDMVVLALIERARVEVGDLPMQDWALRVTLVYRREGDAWLLVHRHADPLVEPISVRHSATLARGERPQGG